MLLLCGRAHISIAKLAAALFIGLLPLQVFAQQTLVSVPELQANVTDLTGTLSPEQTAAISQNLHALEERKATQIAVLIVPTTQPEGIEQYALRVVTQWKLGRRNVDDGTLILIAKNDRRVRIEVGYGLEGVLSDLTTHRIIEEQITPRFKQGDFAGGLEAGINQMTQLIDGEPLPLPTNQRTNLEDDFRQAWPLLLMIAIIFGRLLQRLLGRIPGAITVSVTGGVVVWFTINSLIWGLMTSLIVFFFSLIGFRRVIGQYTGGGKDKCPPSGGSGNFRGGGGSFGGGGSSGRW